MHLLSGGQCYNNLNMNKEASLWRHPNPLIWRKYLELWRKTLAETGNTLNSADDYNHNHGDNMVQTFDMITRAMKEKKKAPRRTTGVCCPITQAAIQQWFSPTLC